jgi:hypothetical protein
MQNNDLEALIKQGKITNKTLVRVQAAKSYIEKKYCMKKMRDEKSKKGKIFSNFKNGSI